MASRLRPSGPDSLPSKLGFNADLAAIAIALTLAALIRLNVLPHIGW